MDQKTLKTIGAAAVGISAVIFVIAWLGMLVEFTGGFAMFERLEGDEAQTSALYLFTLFSLVLFIVAVPFLLGCAFCLFSKGKAVRIITLAVGCVLLACEIAFMIAAAFVPYYGENEFSELAFTSALTYQGELIALLVPPLFLSLALLAAVLKRTESGIVVENKTEEGPQK